MQIATDENGKVWLVGNALPDELNGAKLTLHDLDEEQQAAFDALPSDRSGTVFDGKAFSAVPAEILLAAPAMLDQALAPSTVDQIIAQPDELAKLKAALGIA